MSRASRKPASRKPATVYTSITPHDQTAGIATPTRAQHITSARARRLCRAIEAARSPLVYTAAYPELWHTLLAERDAAQLAAVAATIERNNSEIASTAHMIGLGINVAPITPTEGAVPDAPDRLLQWDAAEMFRRIEAAAAERKNRSKGKRGHKSANRWLAYHCPLCSRQNAQGQWSNTIRCSSSARLIMCAGSAGHPHAPTLCVFDESSQPVYRLQDAHLGAEDMPKDNADGYARAKIGTQSQIQLKASRKRQQVAAPAADKLPPLNPDGVIPF